MAGNSNRGRGLGWAFLFAAISLALCVVGVLSIVLSDVQDWYITNDPYGYGTSPPEPDSTATVLSLFVAVLTFWTGLMAALLLWALKDRASFQRVAPVNRTLMQRLPCEEYRSVVLTTALLMRAAIATLIGTGAILLTIQHSG